MKDDTGQQFPFLARIQSECGRTEIVQIVITLPLPVTMETVLCVHVIFVYDVIIHTYIGDDVISVPRCLVFKETGEEFFERDETVAVAVKFVEQHGDVVWCETFHTWVSMYRDASLDFRNSRKILEEF